VTRLFTFVFFVLISAVVSAETIYHPTCQILVIPYKQVNLHPAYGPEYGCYKIHDEKILNSLETTLKSKGYKPYTYKLKDGPIPTLVLQTIKSYVIGFNSKERQKDIVIAPKELGDLALSYETSRTQKGISSDYHIKTSVLKLTHIPQSHVFPDPYSLKELTELHTPILKTVHMSNNALRYLNREKRAERKAIEELPNCITQEKAVS